jgi:hypothetical protein
MCVEKYIGIVGPSLCDFILVPVTGMAVLVDSLLKTMLIARCCHVNACSTSVSRRTFLALFSVSGCLFHVLSFLLFVAMVAGRFTELDAMLGLPCLLRVDECF